MTPPPATSSTSGTATLKTLLLTDLVGSTELVERLGDQRAAELSARHDRLARALLDRFEGREIDKTDGFLLLFERPIHAVGYALAYHEALQRLGREVDEAIRARVGIHVGEVFLRENPAEEVAQGAKPVEVEGLAKPIAARLMGIAQGGQTLLTRGAFDLARRAAAGWEGASDRLKWLAHGSYLFKGIDEPLEVFEVGVEGWAPLEAPAAGDKARRVGADETVLGWRPAPGLAVPHRPNWTFERKLGQGGFGEVWLAQHVKTRDRRVFKFCFELERVRALQREVTVCRLLRESLGNRPDIARILDWNFDEAPYFLEFEYTEGGNLLEWVEGRGGFSEVPLADRLELAAQIADAVAAAHSVGVLHKDLKPANILVTRGPQGEPRVRVTDFGIGSVTDAARLDALGITVLGMTEVREGATAGSYASGTRIYMAPEVLEGKIATTQADIFSIGILVFQLAVGDFTRALAPGWEREIDDELLREDLAAFVDGHPDRRVASATEVARRLRSLDARRAQLAAERAAAERAAADRRALERSRRRRRLFALVGAALVVFAVAMALQARRIAAEAARANREAVAAQQVTDFLVGLFEVSDPNEAKGNAVTAREILDRGAGRIEQELADQPLVLAKMKDAIGTVYVQLGLTEPGGKLLREAYALRAAQLPPDDPEVANSESDLGWLAEKEGNLDEALRRYTRTAEILRGTRDDEGLPPKLLAKTLDDLGWVYVEQAKYDQALPPIREGLALREERFGPESKEVAGSLTTLAYVHFQRGEAREAAEILRRVLAIQEATSEPGSNDVASAQNNLAVQLRELGDYAEAQALYEKVLATQERIFGPDHETLGSVHNNLGTVLQDQGHLEAAEVHFRRALAIRVKAFGENHPLTALSMNNLGSCLWQRGDEAEAADLWRRAIAVREATLGPDHPQTAVTLANLGLVALRAGDFAEAGRRLERAMVIYGKAFAKDPPGMQGTLVAYEELLEATGRGAEASAIGARLDAMARQAAARGQRLPPRPTVRLPGR